MPSPMPRVSVDDVGKCDWRRTACAAGCSEDVTQENVGAARKGVGRIGYAPGSSTEALRRAVEWFRANGYV